MARKKHPSKEIEEAIQYAEANGWSYHKTGNSAHAWCKLRCSYQQREGCTMSVWSTPKNPGNHARQMRKRVDKCPHNGSYKR